MKPEEALAKLKDISAQVETAVVFDRDGKVVGSTLGDPQRAERLARSALELLTAAEARRPNGGDGVAQLEVALQGASVFVVRDDDRLIAATTAAEPTVGLVFYDLKSCLRDLAAEEAKPARKKSPARTPKKDEES